MVLLDFPMRMTWRDCDDIDGVMVVPDCGWSMYAMLNNGTRALMSGF